MTKIYSKIIIVMVLAMTILACEKEDDATVSVKYPSGIEDLDKQLSMRINFSSDINPDTTTYTYDKLNVSSTITSRDNYRFAYTYNGNGKLETKEQFNNSNNELLATSKFAYGENSLQITIANTDGSRDTLDWLMNGEKGIECLRKFYRTTTASEYLYQYEWTAENVSNYKEYRRINYSTSFNNFEQFPEDLERTRENVVDFYRLEMLEDGSEFYLVKHNYYESFNELVNIERYSSIEVPVLKSQKVPKIHTSLVYDEDNRAYYSNTGYTNCIADDKGYPDRLVTGGADNIKLDFKY